MLSPEMRELPPGMRYLRIAYALTKFRDNTSRDKAWKILREAAQRHYSSESDTVLQEVEVFRTRTPKNILHPGLFHDFLILVGEQGSGKATIARELSRRGYSELTMSNVVRAVAHDFGFSPETTQGKIDAGHAMRRTFDRSILMKLCIVDALQRQQEKLVVDGPRSMYEVRAARSAGGRIIGLITDTDRRKDRAIRFDRVVILRPLQEPSRQVTAEDFYSRDRQESSRSRRMLAVSDTIVVTNRNATELVDKLITH